MQSWNLLVFCLMSWKSVIRDLMKVLLGIPNPKAWFMSSWATLEVSHKTQPVRAGRQVRNLSEMKKIHNGKSTAANFTSTNFGRVSEGPWANCGSKTDPKILTVASKARCPQAAHMPHKVENLQQVQQIHQMDPEISRNPSAQC